MYKTVTFRSPNLNFFMFLGEDVNVDYVINVGFGIKFRWNRKNKN